MKTVFSSEQLARLQTQLMSLRSQALRDAPDSESFRGITAGLATILDELTRVVEGQIFYNQLIATSPTIMFAGLVGAETLTYVSPNIEPPTGYAPASFLTHPGFWAARVPPEDAAKVAELTDRALARHATSVVYEYRFQCADGRHRWFFEQKSFVYDQTGVPVEFIGYVLDITERKQAELALQASEARLAFEAAIIDRVADAIIEIDPAYTIVRWNQAAERIYGWSAEAVLGKPISDVIPVIHYLNGQSWDNVVAAQECHGVWTGQVVQQHHDGHTLVIDGSVRLIRDGAGAIVSRVALNRDITERKRMEDALRESEERYRRLVELSPEAIVVYSGGTLVYINQACLRLAGASSREQLIGRSLLDFVPIERRAAVLATMQHIESRPSVIGPIEEAFTRLDGQPRYIEALAAPIMFEGRPAIQVFIRDITERKQAEASIRMQAHLLNVIDKGVIATDLDGQITFFNRFAESLHGLPEAAVLGRSVIETTVAEPSKAHAAQVLARVRSGEAWSGDLVLRRHDGTTYPAIVTASPVHSELGQVTGLVGVFADITEQKWAEERLHRRMRQRTVIAQLGQTALVTPDQQTFLDETAELVMHALDVDYCTVLELLPGDTTLFLRAGSGWPDGMIGHVRLDAGRDSHSGYTLLSDQPVIVADLRTETRFRSLQLLHDHGVVSGLSVIIRGPGRPFGVLAVHTRISHRFGPEDVNFLQTVANLVGTLIERNHSQETLRRYTDRLRHLRVIDEAILAVQPAETIAQHALRHIRQLVPCMWASITLTNDRADEVTVLAAEMEGLLQLKPVAGSRMFVGDVDFGPRLAAGEACLFDDLAALEYPPRVMQTLRGAGVRSYLITPLLASGRLTGTLNLGAPEPRAFTAEHIEIAREVAATLAVAVQNATLYAAERHAREIADILRAAGLALTQSLALPTVLDTLLRQLAQLVPYDTANVLLLDGDGRLTFLAGHGYDRWSSSSTGVTGSIDPQEHQTFQTILNTRQSLLIPDTNGYAGWETHAEATHVRSFLGVPLLVGDTVIGVYCFDSSAPHFFTPEHVRLAEALAIDAAIAIQHSWLFEQVGEGRDRLMRLSQQLLQVQEVERRQIARELHDEIGQALTALKINLQTVQRVATDQNVGRRVDESISIIEQTLHQVRDLSLELRPSMLDDLGLGSALRWYVERLTERTGVEGTVTVDDEARFPLEIETTGFRVAQEALTNVVRHAQAHNVWVGVQHTDDELLLIISDDGIGFDVQAARQRAVRGESLGLLGMQERVLLTGGELEITATPGHGTEVRARLWFDTAQKHVERRRKVRE